VPRAKHATNASLKDNFKLRVGHRPLFRGKPGFVVYRHLSCALFSESIAQMDQVGGWRRLTSEDQQALKERVWYCSKKKTKNYMLMNGCKSSVEEKCEPNRLDW
jgi:hypothetical protein